MAAWRSQDGKRPPEAAAIAGRLRLTRCAATASEAGGGLIWDTTGICYGYTDTTRIHYSLHFFLKLQELSFYFGPCVRHSFCFMNSRSWLSLALKVVGTRAVRIVKIFCLAISLLF